MKIWIIISVYCTQTLCWSCSFVALFSQSRKTHITISVIQNRNHKGYFLHCHFQQLMHASEPPGLTKSRERQKRRNNGVKCLRQEQTNHTRAFDNPAASKTWWSVRMLNKQVWGNYVSISNVDKKLDPHQILKGN